MKSEIFEILKKKKDIQLGRWFLFSLSGLLLTAVLIVPDRGGSVGLPNPSKLIVNHTTQECADIRIGYGDNAPEDCSIPGGWEEAEYEIADFICPKGYEHKGRFEGEQCLKLSQDYNPQHRPPRRGFGCAPPSY